MSGSGLRVSPYDLIGGIMRYQRMEGSCPERKTMHLPYNIAFFGRVAIRKAKQVPTAPVYLGLPVSFINFYGSSFYYKQKHFCERILWKPQSPTRITTSPLLIFTLPALGHVDISSNTSRWRSISAASPLRKLGNRK